MCTIIPYLFTIMRKFFFIFLCFVESKANFYFFGRIFKFISRRILFYWLFGESAKDWKFSRLCEQFLFACLLRRWKGSVHTGMGKNYRKFVPASINMCLKYYLIVFLSLQLHFISHLCVSNKWMCCAKVI